ncbi:hypothetical protein [Haloechinothrix salitolerans]|uniref:Uncharacterized protein n=1 Tax=Haloechinothrix salitolerans TaxID=926830 RepID=A0ABW2C792_9PSEU
MSDDATDVRTEVVQRLVACRDADDLNDVMATYDPTAAERRVAMQFHYDAAIADLRAAGAVRENSRTIMDITQRQLIALRHVHEVTQRWCQPHRLDRTLGSLMKVMPTDEAETIEGALRWGGLLPPKEDVGD